MVSDIQGSAPVSEGAVDVRRLNIGQADTNHREDRHNEPSGDEQPPHRGPGRPPHLARPASRLHAELGPRREEMPRVVRRNLGLRRPVVRSANRAKRVCVVDLGPALRQTSPTTSDGSDRSDYSDLPCRPGSSGSCPGEIPISPNWRRPHPRTSRSGRKCGAPRGRSTRRAPDTTGPACTLAA